MTEQTSPAAGQPAAAATPVVRTSVATDLALIATFAAFIAVCAVLPAIVVPGLAVPVTLQTFAVLLAGVLLGARRGALAVLLYLAVGLAGFPVFSQGVGGLAVLGRPSLGYLLAFPAAAALAGFIVHRVRTTTTARRTLVVLGATTMATVAVIYPLGIAVMGARLGMSWSEAIAAGLVFLPGDMIKNILVALVAPAALRGFPQLTGDRKPR